MLKILFNKFLLRCGFVKINQKEVITKNEKKARQVLDEVFESNMGIGLIYYRHYMNKLLYLYEYENNEWLAIMLPILTDIECQNIACNYPVSFTEIRNIFPTD